MSEVRVLMNSSSLIVVIVRSVSCFPGPFDVNSGWLAQAGASAACVVLVVGLCLICLEGVFEIALYRASGRGSGWTLKESNVSSPRRFEDQGEQVLA